MTNISAAVILIVTIAVSAYDILPAINETPGDTISAVLRSWAKEWIVVPYIWGVLGGHWFLGYSKEIVGLETPLFSIWVVFLASLTLRSYGVEIPMWARLLALIVGILVGHFFWSQV